jgi:hypothetical protein
VDVGCGEGRLGRVLAIAFMSLAAYFEALEAAGFMVESLREPVALRGDGAPYVNFVHLRGRLLGR